MFQVKFQGRKLGASGKFYTLMDTVEIDPRVDEMGTRLELSEKYEHISNIKVIEIQYPNCDNNSSNWCGMCET